MRSIHRITGFLGQIILLLAFSIAAVPLWASTSQQQLNHSDCPALDYEIGSYQSNGRRIQIEQYRPRLGRGLPVVILIHGAGGVYSRTEASTPPLKDNFGEKRFACGGFIVLVPHYFDGTNQVTALNRDEIVVKSPIWLQVLEDVVSYALRMNGAHARIFLFGESLGGYLSIAIAARDRHIAALSTFGAGWPPGLRIKFMPPVLIQHGEDDDIVPLSEATRLRAELKSRRFGSSLKTYRGLGHYANWQMQQVIADEAMAFFRHGH